MNAVDTDIELARRCTHGDSESLHALTRYSKPLTEFLIRKGANPKCAEECIQDIWLRCIPNPSQGKTSILTRYHGRTRLEYWLRTVCLNQFLDNVHYRRTRRERSSLHEKDFDRLHEACDWLDFNGSGRDHSKHPCDSIHHLMHATLREAFSALTAEEKILLNLHFVEEIEQKELACVWGVNRSTISRRIKSMIRRLQKHALSAMQAFEPEITITPHDMRETAHALKHIMFNQ